MSLSVRPGARFPTENDRDPANPTEFLRTIIALFDDIIDAEHALTSLRKSDQPSEGISVILRERVLDPDPTVQYQTVLSRVIASSALDAVGSWLQGLASLILPDRASYLVAGPIGAVLATIKDARPAADGEAAVMGVDDSSRQLSRALSAFGFSQDESHYLEERVVAGSPLIAVTSSKADKLRAAHKTFAQFDAVHVGLARTESSIHQTATRLLVTGPDGGGSVVIADAIAPLRRLTSDGGWRNHSIDLRGRQAISVDGEAIGTIVDVLFENRIMPEGQSLPRSAADRRSVIIRYVLVSFGGVLGMGKSRVAVPAMLADTTGWQVRIDTTREELRAAPRFDSLAPLSRQDEVTICSYFDVPLYWLNNPDRLT
ncbi:MAG: PRC-barrel domain-containing protein [Chloroflexota bacterium]|nr:PRC-barrel domain-containing protein [Chloroflexota bacterium]